MGGTVLVVQHEANCGPGHLRTWASASGVALRVLHPWDGEPVPTRVPDDVTGLVVLGGDMGAYDDTAHPWLTPTKALLAAAVAADVPVLGVCLGHQLLTVALGGEVRRNPAGQVRGIVGVSVGAGEGVERGPDEVFGALPGGAPVLQWNRDVAVALPPGAHVLARDSTGAPHVVRFAPRAWGVQVHPEACVEDARTWGTDGADMADVAGELAAHTEDVLAAWAPTVGAFFALTSPDAPGRAS